MQGLMATGQHTRIAPRPYGSTWHVSCEHVAQYRLPVNRVTEGPKAGLTEYMPDGRSRPQARTSLVLAAAGSGCAARFEKPPLR